MRRKEKKASSLLQALSLSLSLSLFIQADVKELESQLFRRVCEPVGCPRLPASKHWYSPVALRCRSPLVVCPSYTDPKPREPPKNQYWATYLTEMSPVVPLTH